jgi:hypothetical protein|tara:strand:+ start:205 stop:450 length:246 start_codon:yes stop_codon:yes gene_type:complete
VESFNLILIEVVSDVFVTDEIQELFVEGVILHLLANLSEACKVERRLSWDVEFEALLQTKDPLERRGVHFLNNGSEIIVVV